jgi:hypothetical protein
MTVCMISLLWTPPKQGNSQITIPPVKPPLFLKRTAGQNLHDIIEKRDFMKYCGSGFHFFPKCQVACQSNAAAILVRGFSVTFLQKKNLSFAWRFLSSLYIIVFMCPLFCRRPFPASMLNKYSLLNCGSEVVQAGSGISEYLKNGGNLEITQHMAIHESTRTNGLYDRRTGYVLLDEVERILT